MTSSLQLQEYGDCLVRREQDMALVCNHNMTTVIGLESYQEEEEEQEEGELEQEQGEVVEEDVPHQDRLQAGSDVQGPTLLLLLLSCALLTLTRLN